MTSHDEHPISSSTILGANLRRVRRERKLSQADLAAEAAGVGMPWTRSTVKQVEGGTRRVYDDEVTVLTQLLGVTREELYRVEPGATARLAGGVDVSSEDLERVQRGLPWRTRPVRARPFGKRIVLWDDWAVLSDKELMNDSDFLYYAGLLDVDVAVVIAAFRERGKADELVAQQTEASLLEVVAAAASLWGHSAEEERQARLAALPEDGRDPRRRGHLMRTVVAEVRDRMTEWQQSFLASLEDG